MIPELLVLLFAVCSVTTVVYWMVRLGIACDRIKRIEAKIDLLLKKHQ